MTPYRSHNPLGALMVYAISGCLLTIIATGIAMAGPPPWNGEPEAPEHRTTAVAAHSHEEEGDDDGIRGDHLRTKTSNERGDAHAPSMATMSTETPLNNID